MVTAIVGLQGRSNLSLRERRSRGDPRWPRGAGGICPGRAFGNGRGVHFRHGHACPARTANSLFGPLILFAPLPFLYRLILWDRI